MTPRVLGISFMNTKYIWIGALVLETSARVDAKTKKIHLSKGSIVWFYQKVFATRLQTKRTANDDMVHVDALRWRQFNILLRMSRMQTLQSFLVCVRSSSKGHGTQNFQGRWRNSHYFDLSIIGHSLYSQMRVPAEMNIDEGTRNVRVGRMAVNSCWRDKSWCKFAVPGGSVDIRLIELCMYCTYTNIIYNIF